eukprot:scpid77607/ scgid35695/ 
MMIIMLCACSMQAHRTCSQQKLLSNHVSWDNHSPLALIISYVTRMGQSQPVQYGINYAAAAYKLAFYFILFFNYGDSKSDTFQFFTDLFLPSTEVRHALQRLPPSPVTASEAGRQGQQGAD